jgi:monofunctional biosynthetic peptidoglycan transglycosylase
MNVDPSGRRRRLVRGALIALLALVAGLATLWFALPDPAAWARANPTTTALIEQRRAEARAAGRRFQPSIRWIPLEQISRRLVDAVVASEDAKFFGHGGFDWEALRSAFRHNLARGRYARGASTITQQLAKNLYLGTEKSLLRKGREALLSAKLERRLDKRRILALYLNVAEWGDGVFGADAGARRHFGTGAASLTTAQAVVLAAMLPAPRRASLSPAPAWLAARSRGLLARLLDEQVVAPAEHEIARAELERYLGRAPEPGDEEAELPPDEEAAEPTPGTPSAPLAGTPATAPAAPPATDPATVQELAPAVESPPGTVPPDLPEPPTASPDSPASPSGAAPTPAVP